MLRLLSIRFALIAAMMSVGPTSLLAQGPLLPPPPTLAHAPEQTPDIKVHPFSYLGPVTCSSTGCHGSLEVDSPTWQRSYLMWSRRDPHANAHQALYSDLSVEMGRKLQLEAPPWKTQECLACHASPPHTGLPSEQNLSGDDLTSFGISCEACHGPSPLWLEPHRGANWNDNSPASVQAHTELGFINTKDVTTRAQLCADCHVGGEGRDVNHLFIAAGHPRLTFEYSAYMDLYAQKGAHWSIDDDELRIAQIAGHPNDVRPYNWTIGRVVSAQKSLALTAMRASNPKADWPEFAAFNCYACHHDLSRGLQESRPPQTGMNPPSWRQEQYSHKRPGQLVRNNWDDDLVQASLAALIANENDRPVFKRDLLDELLRKSSEQARQQVAQISRDDAHQLSLILKKIQNDPAAVTFQTVPLNQKLSSISIDTDIVDWDEAAQLYLALAALKSPINDPRSREIEIKTFDEVRQQLAFPNIDPTSTSPAYRYNSPHWLQGSQLESARRGLTELLRQPR